MDDGGGGVDFPKSDLEQSIADRFEEMVHRHGGRVAIRDSAGSMSYQELNRQANRVAHEILAERGTGAEPVAVLADHGRAVAIGVLGIFKAGKIVTALHPSNPPARIRSILETAGVGLLVADENQSELARGAAEGIAKVMVMENGNRQEDASDPVRNVAPSDPAWILHTSGSTGEAKGVFQSHRNMLHGVWWCAHMFKVGPEDRLSCLLPCSVVGGMREILLPLLNGASLHPRDLKRDGLTGFADWLAAGQITVCRFISSVFRSFAGMLDGSEDLSSLRVIYLGGESLTTADVELFQKYFPRNCICINAFGATEAGINRYFVIDHDTRLSGSMVPVGYTVDEFRTDLLDEEGSPVPQGEVGEIVVTSRYLALGYWNRPELTRQCFTPAGGEERTYCTGDLGRFLPDGCLEFLGRKDSQVSVNGYRVELGEVEAALLRLEQVADGVATTRTTGGGHTSLIAFVILKPDTSVSVAELQELLRRRLPDYMVPTAIVFVDSLPRKPNGKIDFKALPFPETKPEKSTGRLATPRNDTERKLRDIWEKSLGVRPIGIDENFIELGGDSLHAVQVMALVAKEFGRDLRPATLFEAPTIEKLAAFLRGSSVKQTRGSLLPVRQEGSRTPFFWIHGDHSYAVLPRHLDDDRPIWGLDHQGQNGTRVEHTEVKTIAAYYLSEIRKVRPHGPYLIGGYSFGGIAAFEVAQTLRREGEEVPLLFILDSSCPGDFPDPEKPGKSPRQMPEHLHPARKAVRRVKWMVWDVRDWFIDLGKWWWCKCSLALDRPLPPTLRTFYILTTYHKARHRYDPQPYPGDVVYVNCSLRGTTQLDRWKRVFKGNLDTLEVPGNHNTMRQEEGVRRWAPLLKRRLDAADPLPSRPNRKGIHAPVDTE